MRIARRLASVVLPVVALVATTLTTTTPSSAEEPVGYAPPVDAPLERPFDITSQYGPGNRGLDYDTEPGQEVRAASPGEVTFSGEIVGTHHVVVLHADGLRTSYSFLTGASVVRGDRVEVGTVLGTAGDELHFGARAGERYVDPAVLLGTEPPTVHLVPVELRAPQSESDERSLLERALDGIVAVNARPVALAVGVAHDAAPLVVGGAQFVYEYAAGEVEDRIAQVRTLAHLIAALPITPQFYGRLFHELEVIGNFEVDQAACTATAEPPPPPPHGRRIVVLVAGFGSTSDGTSIDEVDPTVLGVDEASIVRFSYAGGRVPSSEVAPDLARLPANPYGADDANGDLVASAEELRALLAAIAVEAPGVPVEVVAHSQGGVIASLALAERDRPAGAEPPAPLPVVPHLVTFGSPYRGTDIATANRLAGTTNLGPFAQVGVELATGGTVDGRSDAAEQLDETSSTVAGLVDLVLPPDTRVTSIAADGDLVVPAIHAVLPNATNVLVPLRGATAHAELPASPVATRELALALADRPPTCDTGANPYLAVGISHGEDLVGGAIAGGLLYLDLQARLPHG